MPRLLTSFGLALLFAPSLALARPAPPIGICGNNVIEPGETCDDGNLTDNDGCSSLCQDETDGGAGFVPPPQDGGGRPPPPLDAAMPDIGPPPDADVPPDDAGPRPDGGDEQDSGTEEDAGIEPDSGAPPSDAGFSDTGVHPDSGSTEDSGSPSDSGRPDSMLQVFTPPPVETSDGESGCGCSTHASTDQRGLFGLAIVGLFFARRRK
jgi:large repetitive protein